MSILLFIVILGTLVVVHELGHFLAARRSGVRVEEFGLGFPPRLFGRRYGATLYSINAIPFGGFVRLHGEQSGEQADQGSFQAASTPKKVLIMAAGVLMNYALAWVILTAVFSTGVTVDPSTVKLDSGATLTNRQTQAIVTTGGVAEQSGLATGDQIITINGRIFSSTEEIAAFARQANFPPLTFDVIHGNVRRQVTLQAKPVVDPQAPHYEFGLAASATVTYPWYTAPWVGLRSTISLSWQSVVGFGQVISQFVRSGRLSQDVAGPVGIAVLTGEVTRLGASSLLQFVALLSISLAVINFLPIPALDGGRAWLLIIQRVIRRTISPRVENYIHAAGFYALLLMILLISIRDVRRFELIDRVIKIFNPS